MGGLVGYRAGRALLCGPHHQRRRRTDGRQDRLDRVPRRIPAGGRRRPDGDIGTRVQGRDRGRDPARRRLAQGPSGRGVRHRGEGPPLGRRQMHPAAARDLHRKGCLYRRARQDRQEDLHPGQGLFQPGVRRQPREVQGRRVMEDLRVDLRPRRDGDPAGAARGDPAGGGLGRTYYDGRTYCDARGSGVDSSSGSSASAQPSVPSGYQVTLT